MAPVEAPGWPWVPSGEQVLPHGSTLPSPLWCPCYSTASCKRFEVHFRTRPGINRHTHTCPRIEWAMPGINNRANTMQSRHHTHLSVEGRES